MICPINKTCVGLREGSPERYPVKTRKLKRSAQSLWVLLARDARGRVWLEKRPAKGIWAGLYCLPVFDSREDLFAALPPVAQRGAQDLPPFVHVLTHKDLHLHPVLLEGVQPQGDIARWVDAEAWGRLGLPAPVRKLLENSSAA
jgi:A/G-specific adenine glycosylase